MIRLLTVLAGSGFLIASTVLAQAADPIKLRVADSFPKGHFLVKLVLEPWMEQVSKRTSNAVTFEHYPAQQLGKAADMNSANAARPAGPLAGVRIIDLTSVM